MAAVFVPSPTLLAQIRADPEIGATFQDLGKEGLDIGKRLAPRGETGNLRKSMKVNAIGGRYSHGARISVNVEYWFFPEYGVNQSAQPYMRPIITSLGMKPSGAADTVFA